MSTITAGERPSFKSTILVTVITSIVVTLLVVVGVRVWQVQATNYAAAHPNRAQIIAGVKNDVRESVFNTQYAIAKTKPALTSFAELNAPYPHTTTFGTQLVREGSPKHFTITGTSSKLPGSPAGTYRYDSATGFFTGTGVLH